MPFAIPTLQELVQRTANAFRADLKGSDAMLWPNNVAVSAKVMAGAVKEPFSFLQYISEQFLVHTAEGQWLDKHAFDWGLARLPASYAQGKATVTGDPGVAVPAGVVLQRADGVQYEVTTGGTTSGGGSVEVSIKALAVGKAGNTVAGVQLAFTVPQSQLDIIALVAAGGIGLGADQEGDASLQARILFRKRFPPHGGAAHDYVSWAREIPGVTRVFVDPVTATNLRTSVGVWFLMDDLYTNGIPQAADVAAVEAYIDTVRPAGAIVAVAAPTAVAVPVTINGLAPDTAAIRGAIQLELTDLFRRVRVSTISAPYTLYRSKIIEAVSIATGEDHHTLTLPASDVLYSAGQLPVLGTISYT